MGVTRTGSQGQGTSEAGLGPSEPDVQEHPANELTASTATESPTTQLDPPTTQVESQTGQSEPATSPLLSGSMGDRCANCGAPLAGDQRYCVNCGERRGATRFASAAMPAPAAARAAGPPPERSRSWPSAATVIAGIATLLIAMGVGVLIGKAGNNSNSKAPAAQVITVNGGGSSGGSSGGTSSGSTGSTLGTTQGSSGTHHATGGSSHTTGGSSHTTKHQVTKATAAAKSSKPTSAATKKAGQASSGVTGGSAGQSNNTVTTGGSCKAGSAGCTNGHFSGNFFGQ